MGNKTKKKLKYWPKCSKFEENCKPTDPTGPGNLSINYMKKNTLGCIIMTLLWTNEKERTLKTARERDPSHREEQRER